MRIEITSKAGCTTVKSDGVKIGRLTQVEFDVSVDHPIPRLRLTVLPDRLLVDADDVVRIVQQHRASSWCWKCGVDRSREGCGAYAHIGCPMALETTA